MNVHYGAFVGLKAIQAGERVYNRIDVCTVADKNYPLRTDLRQPGLVFQEQDNPKVKFNIALHALYDKICEQAVTPIWRDKAPTRFEILQSQSNS
jgi:hypothetical protein